MVRGREPTACEALTARGAPCQGTVSYAGDLGAAGHRRLCGYHWHMAQHRPIPLWNRPIDPAELAPPATPKLRWTVEHDELLRAHPGEHAAAVAPLLGRTTAAVRQRRARLRRARLRRAGGVGMRWWT